MSGSDTSTDCLRKFNVPEQVAQLKTSNARPLVKRLWESHLDDLTATLEAFNTGAITEAALHEEIGRLVPILQSLRVGGRLQEVLDRAQIVILDNVMQDIGT